MNEQVKNNIMEYKQKYLQKLTDAQVPELSLIHISEPTRPY